MSSQCPCTEDAQATHICALEWRKGTRLCVYISHQQRRCLDHWRETWRLEWSPGVVKAWQLAASKLSSHRFEIRQEYVQGDIRSHGDAIYHLELPCQVIDPASVWQIRREAWLEE
ncbi:hypothetical protein LZ32DRAFT_289689 [Colletotrichum eremochloae]|nr:hypothetical protein LZ32DRAFT_289689 [Colletotrichum eremochloae]